jgi:two-component system, NarL family, response regulator LiaR
VTDIQQSNHVAESARSLRTLLVCGDEHLRTVLAWILAEDGRFELVGSVARGDHAAAWKHPFDTVLIDLAIPGLDALATIRTLRRRYPALTVVVLSPVDVPYLRAASSEAGANGYIDRSRLDGPGVIDQLAVLSHAGVEAN